MTTTGNGPTPPEQALPPMPFPGMDPYLEHPMLWESLHLELIVGISHQLSPILRPRYVASLEQRVYVELEEHSQKRHVWVRKTAEHGGGIGVASDVDVATPVVVEVPELEIKERYIEILDRYQEMKVVTVIELVSPSNKRSGPGRDSYVAKQHSTLASDCHLVEIDLLRNGQHVMAVPESELPEKRLFEYLISVNRWPWRNRFELYPVRLRDRLPKFGIPLVEPDPDVSLDLQAALEQVYAGSSYMLQVRYHEPCQPPLAPEDQKWASERWAVYRKARPELFPGA